MSSLTLPAVHDARRPSSPSLHWRRRCTALGTTIGLHLGLGALLLSHWQVSEPPAPQVSTVQLQLLTLTPPAPPEPPAAIPELPQPAQPDPAIERQRLEQAALARKRAEQQRLEQEQQRQRDLQREQERRRREAEAREQLEQQRLAEQREQAERQQAAAAAAERARQAEAAAAASREFLPIAKQAPAYPQRALDKGLEGQCTVRYRVNEQGRVENPEAEPDCHPLFVHPSLNAAKRFRYQPRVVDGRAVAVANVRNTFTYRIE
ncbi:energy transducer TonB [Pseudomonas sp. SP16.1]|uniref:energy transducer TonB n=1 Tax=Pseudomonas sp. SP16.1 TaxID=3458854 RepID=UPI0040465D32